MNKISLVGLHNFQKQIKSLQKSTITKDLLDELADIAVETIQREHDTIYKKYSSNFKGANDEQTTVKKTGRGSTRTITARGKSVLFIEYGAGVYFNTPQSERPANIANIGEYGHHLGKLSSWRYEGADGKTVRTRGNPAALGVTKAMQAMQQRLKEKGL